MEIKKKFIHVLVYTFGGLAETALLPDITLVHKLSSQVLNVIFIVFNIYYYFLLTYNSVTVS